MKKGLILDLDQTLIDTSIAEPYRGKNWNKVYELIPHFKTYDFLIELVSDLIINKIQLCVVTSSPSIYCTKVLNYYKFPISNMVCYHDTKNRKPHPEPILLALAKLNLKAEEVISAGDRDIDIVSSHAAGVDTIGCLWGSPDPDSLLKEKPKYITTNPQEFNDLARKLFIL